MANKVGPPVKYPKVSDLKKVVDDYFATTDDLELTISGLALAVGCKDTVYRYGERAGFKRVIKEARLKIEGSYEKDLRKKGRSGDIFALKNFGWKDKQEIKQEISGSLSLEDILTKK